MRRIVYLVLGVMLISCGNNVRKLPYLGVPTVKQSFRDGKTVYDSIYPVVPGFTFTDQDSTLVTNDTFSKGIYVADFIFLSCPAICPRMTANLKTVYDHYSVDSRVHFISHTIDPEDDTIPRLKAFKESLGVDGTKWHFVTGNQDSIYHLAEKGYFSTAYKDSTAPGGFVHSGGLLLVDANRHIRGVYNGTDKEAVQQLINDIELLLKENVKTD